MHIAGPRGTPGRETHLLGIDAPDEPHREHARITNRDDPWWAVAGSEKGSYHFAVEGHLRSEDDE